jgi:hypothetical protein
MAKAKTKAEAKPTKMVLRPGYSIIDPADNRRVITAQAGTIVMSDDPRYLLQPHKFWPEERAREMGITSEDYPPEVVKDDAPVRDPLAGF